MRKQDQLEDPFLQQSAVKNDTETNHALWVAVCAVNSLAQLPVKIIIDFFLAPYVLFSGITSARNVECCPCAQCEYNTYHELSEQKSVDDCSKIFMPIAHTIYHAERACAFDVAPVPAVPTMK